MSVDIVDHGFRGHTEASAIANSIALVAAPCPSGTGGGNVVSVAGHPITDNFAVDFGVYELRACSSSSSKMRIPAPFTHDKTIAIAHRRVYWLAGSRFGLLRVERVFAEQNPAKDSGVTADSVPPLIIAS